MQVETGHALGRHPAHPGNLFYRQGGHEGVHLVRRNHKQAVGLAPVAGHLGKKLVGRHAGGYGNAQLPANILS